MSDMTSDGSGALSKEEITRAFAIMGMNLSPEQVAMLFDDFDKDHSGIHM